MTEDIKKEKIMLEDGRRAERVVKGNYNPETQESVEVVETWVEPKLPQRLARRQIVKTKPCVYERQTELINEETGEVVQTEVENLDPGVKLQVREKIVSAASVPTEETQDNCLVTRDELREDIKDAMVVLANAIDKSVDKPEESSLSMQSVIESRNDGSKLSTLNVIFCAVIAAAVGGIAWILWAM